MEHEENQNKGSVQMEGAFECGWELTKFRGAL
jgi:hypothetical protein